MACREKKVGYLLKTFPRLSQTFILDELLAHEAAGRDIDLLVCREPYDEPRSRRLERLRARPRYFGRELTYPELVRAAAREVVARKIEHLHAHFASYASTVAMDVAREASIGFSFTAHGRDIFHHSVDRQQLASKLAAAKFVVAVSQFNREYLNREFELPGSKVMMIHNGLDLSRWTYETARPCAPLVLAVGRLIEKKGFADLIEACRILKAQGVGFRCEIIGKGALEHELAAHIKQAQLADCVQLRGACPSEVVRERMRVAAMVVVPSISAADGDREGLPTVVLEALALGTPCLASHTTGIPEAIVHGETGWLVPERAPHAIARGVRRLLLDPDLSEQLAIAGRRHVERRFDARVSSHCLRNAFDSATDAVQVCRR